MNTVTITAEKLCELLGIDPTQGIFDISMDAWDVPQTVIKIITCPTDQLTSKGLH